MKRQPRIQSDDEHETEPEEEQKPQPKQKSERKLQFEEMKTRHESLQLEFQELKKGFTDMNTRKETERTMRKNDDIDMLRKNDTEILNIYC